MIVGKTRPVSAALERKHHLKLPPEGERSLGCDLVRTICDRGDEPHPRREVAEAIALGLEQRATRFLDLPKHVADAFLDSRHDLGREHIRTMARDADGEHEGNRRWALRRRPRYGGNRI